MSLALLCHNLVRWRTPLVLCLHSVGEGPDYLPVDVFLDLVDLLKERKYRFVTADELTRPFLFLRRVVALTFDDGRRDNSAVVLPLLRRLGIPATFYVCPGLIGRRVHFGKERCWIDPGGSSWCFDLMTWSNVRELVDAGMCVGSHTLTHADLERSADEEAFRELRDSRRMLEDELQIPIKHLAYPWGRRNRRTPRIVRRAGYVTAVATARRSFRRSRLYSRYSIPRITIQPSATRETFPLSVRGDNRSLTVAAPQAAESTEPRGSARSSFRHHRGQLWRSASLRRSLYRSI